MVQPCGFCRYSDNLRITFSKSAKTNMDKLRAMGLLVATAETGSFSATARRVGMSTASVSRRVSELEAHLGVTLIHRSTRALTLSEAGETYVVHARAILAQVAQTEAGASAVQDAPQGVLRVHSRTIFGLSVLTGAQAAFSRQHPNLTVELYLSEHPARLREDGFDVDFRMTRPTESGIAMRQLLQSHRVLVASPAYLEQAPALTTPRDLDAHQCLVYWLDSDPPFWRFRKEDIAIAPRFASNNGQVLRQAARQGQGVALLDDYTVAQDIRAGRLVRLLPDYRVTNTSFDTGIYAIWLDAPQIPAKVRLYLDHIATCLTERPCHD